MALDGLAGNWGVWASLSFLCSMSSVRGLGGDQVIYQLCSVTINAGRKSNCLSAVEAALGLIPRSSWVQSMTTCNNCPKRYGWCLWAPVQKYFLAFAVLQTLSLPLIIIGSIILFNHMVTENLRVLLVNKLKFVFFHIVLTQLSSYFKNLRSPPHHYSIFHHCASLSLLKGNFI